MKKNDIIAALVIGEVVSLFLLAILRNIEIETGGVIFGVLPVTFPILSVFGLWVAYLISKKILIVWQIAKFVLVGALNTFIDLGVLNFLIFTSGIVSGLFYSIFKGISFTIASTNSYFWNKFWTFESKKAVERREFSQFFLISIVGLLINVSVASLIVNIIGPQFGLSPEIWANIGAIGATFAGMTWNFLGYKFWVFQPR